jgi:thiosulfate/3-mercaptopyruvate sulfurtransferase
MNPIKTEPVIEKRGYAHPEALVSTAWVAAHLDDPTVRIVESNEDPLVYPSGHIPGAAEVDWTRDLNDPLRRDYLGPEAFAALARRLGLTPRTTVVFYGDRNNWWAAYAFWIFRLFGHGDVRIMDGGRLKWEQEKRPLTHDVPIFTPTDYEAPERNDLTHRAWRDQVLAHVRAARPLIDVRTLKEFSGELLHMPEYPNEGALRGGHIPGAVNIPWSRAISPEDGTFKPADALRAIYQQECGLAPEDDVIVYCRIGERSSHTWFVLTCLLGFLSVRNYDGSWTEWGNLVGVPVER